MTGASMMEFARRFLNDETGATALEYGVLIALLSIVVLTAATALFNRIGLKFNTLTTALGGS